MVTPSIFKNNLRIIAGSKPKLSKNNEAQQKIRCSYEIIVCIAAFEGLNLDHMCRRWGGRGLQPPLVGEKSGVALGED